MDTPVPIPDNLPLNFCCEGLKGQLFKNVNCIQHGWACPDRVVTVSKEGVFGIRHPDGASYYKINFCPWCGSRLHLEEFNNHVPVRNLIRVGIYKIEEVLPFAVEDKRDRNHIREYDGKRVKMTSLRYQCFLKSGTDCVCCGLMGEYFALEKHSHPNQANPYDSYHFNLYAMRQGKEILFTKDHIFPASRGGQDHVSNFQTMCEPCNSFKGSRFSKTKPIQ